MSRIQLKNIVNLFLNFSLEWYGKYRATRGGTVLLEEEPECPGCLVKSNWKYSSHMRVR